VAHNRPEKSWCTILGEVNVEKHQAEIEFVRRLPVKWCRIIRPNWSEIRRKLPRAQARAVEALSLLHTTPEDIEVLAFGFFLVGLGRQFEPRVDHIRHVLENGGGALLALAVIVYYDR
jgi:hypothetical protein